MVDASANLQRAQLSGRYTRPNLNHKSQHMNCKRLPNQVYPANAGMNRSFLNESAPAAPTASVFDPSLVNTSFLDLDISEPHAGTHRAPEGTSMKSQRRQSTKRSLLRRSPRLMKAQESHPDDFTHPSKQHKTRKLQSINEEHGEDWILDLDKVSTPGIQSPEW